jgi:LacI family transcriptional regulator
MTPRMSSWVQPLTSRDVARIAGVSQATVSRVLTNSPSVAPATADRVREALERVGYQPNAAARAMRSRRSGTVGVVTENLSNPFYPELLRALGAELQRYDLRMILWDAETGPGLDAAVEAIEQHLVDGLLFTAATEHSQPFRRAVSKGAPMVLVNRKIDDCPCDQVVSENAQAAATIARYFLSHGRQALRMITGPDDAATARERLRGFVAGAASCGIALTDDSFAASDFSHDGGMRATESLLSRSPHADAIFCANDAIAFGAVDALRLSGRAVPDDVWVVGYDDVEMAAWPIFGLTTARQSLGEMASVAIRMLWDRVDGTAKHKFARQEFLRSDLIIRKSTDNAPLTEVSPCMQLWPPRAGTESEACRELSASMC